MKIIDNGIGYNIVKIGGKNLYIHRIIYETFVGIIPSNK